MKSLAVIPARGGSKRIPRKNIREFCGRPIIDYSIQAAKAAGVFDRIIVSTDCDEIANVAENCGAEVPFRRSAALSDDHTPTIPVIADAINQLASQGARFDYACCIYATAPLVSVNDLTDGLQQVSSDSEADFLFPVTSFPFPIFRGLEIEGNRVKMLWPEHELTRSQDMPAAFHDAGQFYWGTSAAWLNRTGLFSARSIPLIIPRYRVCDIDTPEDWIRAELLFQINNAR